MTIYEQIRTISNPVRLDILKLLRASGQLQAREILTKIDHDISVNLLSHHLSKLRLNNLVLAESYKGRPQYRVNQEAVTSVLSELKVLGE